MVLIAYSAAGIITGPGAGHWDTMVEFLGQGTAGTGIVFADAGTAANPHLTTLTADMQAWFVDGQRQFNIVANDSGGGGVPGPNLRLIGDTLTSEPTLALHQTNAVLADTLLGSLVGDASNVNLYSFPAAYSLVFFTYDTSGDAVGEKLLIGPGDTATVQWWANAWFRIFSDQAGAVETFSINGQTGLVNVYGNILDADVGTNSVGTPANEFLNMYIATNGSYFMANDQHEWMTSTGTEIRWGVGNANELYLSTTALGPVVAEGLSLGGTANEYLNAYIGTGRLYFYTNQEEYIYSSGTNLIFGVAAADVVRLSDLAFFPDAADTVSLGIATLEFANLYIGDTGGIYLGLDQDGYITWDNATSRLYIYTDDGAAGHAARMQFGAGVASGVSTIEVHEQFIFNREMNLVPDAITATSGGVAASVNTSFTEITTNGDADLDNVTLANSLEGAIKIFGVVAVGNVGDSVKITPANMIGGTQITFAANPIGLGCIMAYDPGVPGWVVVANNGGTIT